MSLGLGFHLRSMVQSAAMDWDQLYDIAREAQQRAYAPYSRFQVGAALLTGDGTIFAGCNVENRSFGLCLCAERLAVSSAVASGHKDLRAIAVVTSCSPPAMPCGMCLETLSEFSQDMPILVANPDGERREYTLREIHPQPFQWPK